MKDKLLSWRKEFPILKTSTYLVSHSLGAMPRQAYAKLKEYADIWSTQGIDAWDETWFPLLLETGDRIGSILGAGPGQVIMHQNVSTLMAILISCLDITPKRNKVVYTDMNFPTVHYNWLVQQQARGIKVDLVRSPDGISVPTDDFVRRIDDSTVAVVIDHVLFRSSALQDAQTLIRAAHRKGALAIMDVYQAAGTVPMDVKKLDVDFLVGGSVKWLCGGPGACYLYVKKDLIKKFKPKITGWLSHKSPFSFDMERMDYADTITRYLGGTPSVPALYAAQAGHRIIQDITVPRIREKSIRQTSLLIRLAQEQGLKINTPLDPTRRGGTVCVDFPGAEAASHELLRRRFMMDYRPHCGIRISPHFYTEDAELHAIIDEIKKLRRKTK